jgi:hypothetical protein
MGDITVRRPSRLFLMLTVCAAATAQPGSAGQLDDVGPNGQFFYDLDAGRFWFDPALFEGEERPLIDDFVTASSRWSWGTSAEISALVGQSCPSGQVLADVLGSPQSGGGGAPPRWFGFHASPDQPDGWYVEATSAPFTALDGTGGQNLAGELASGAWVTSTLHPVGIPRLSNLGRDGEFFHDEATDLYWCDPAIFAGLSRSEVQAWLDAHPAFRWATLVDVRDLVGRLAAGDVALTEVMGAPQSGGDDPRWVGYYDLDGQPDGLVIQARWLTPRSLVATWSTQDHAADLNAGAWVITEDDPMPVERPTWSGVKRCFR